MKVTVSQLRDAISLFGAEMVQQATKSINKFVIGVAFAKARKSVDAIVKEFTGEDGLVDCDAIKGYVDAGLMASGGSLVIEPPMDGALKMLGVTLERLEITRAEADRFFGEILKAVVDPVKAVQ